MLREERVTVQGPVKNQQPDGMTHRGGGAEVLPSLTCQGVSGCPRPGAIRPPLTPGDPGAAKSSTL